MLEFGQIDRSSAVPLYEQIANSFRAAISSHHLASGKRLPGESKLAAQFGVARMTARRALQQLRYEGLVVPASGRGLAVAALPSGAGVCCTESLLADADTLKTSVSVLVGELRMFRSLNEQAGVRILEVLACTEMAMADVFGALAIRLNPDGVHAAHHQEVIEGLETARHAFAEAARASQNAAQVLLRGVTESDSPKPRTFE